jgi:hypothetical protein
MPYEMNKQLHVIMSLKDEERFSSMLLSEFPSTVFLDGKTWPTPEPIMRSSIVDCTNPIGLVCIWNRDLFPSIPVGSRPGGGFEGPCNGPVIQFIRSRTEGVVLRGGGVDAGFADPVPPEVKRYFNAVWCILKRNATNKLMCVDPESRAVINPKVTDLWAWPDAIKWCLADDQHLFGDNSINYYRPAHGLNRAEKAFDA